MLLLQLNIILIYKFLLRIMVFAKSGVQVKIPLTVARRFNYIKKRLE